MAIGKSGEAADRDKLSIWFGPHLVAKDGERAPDYVEKTVAAYMQGREIVIRADVGVGNGQRHRVDLRPDARLHLDQRRLSQLRQSSSAAVIPGSRQRIAADAVPTSIALGGSGSRPEHGQTG